MKSFPFWPAFFQKRTQVVVREPGERTYGPPIEAYGFAKIHCPYALLSEVAYGATKAAAVRAKVAGKAPEELPNVAINELTAAGWAKVGFFDSITDESATLDGLRVQVWENRARNEVVVAFGGTFFWSWDCWVANLRWFWPHKSDQYTEVVKVVGPLLVEWLRQRAPAALDSAPLKLTSTGHSLGGGLAQEFAYALPTDSPIRVSNVFAFDPSPVTGFFTVAPAVRDHNKLGLAVARIFERHEVLALIRSLLNILFRPSARNPAITTIRYSVMNSWNPIADHSIERLAAGISRLARASVGL